MVSMSPPLGGGGIPDTEAALRDEELKQSIVNRLKSVEGHIRGIQRMVEQDQYCVDILNQTSAIHKAMEKVDVMILENHLQTCVTTAIRSEDPRERERVIRELLVLFQGGAGSPVGGKLRVQDLESLTAGDGGRCCP
jgi:CsoR family transcriptional regulator, copper-sensing transcriptional repressor